MPDQQPETTSRSGKPPKELEYLGLFQEVTRMITATLDVAKVLELIARKVPEVVGVDASTIRLLDPTGKNLLLVAAHGLSREYLERGPVDAESSVMMAMSGTPVAVYDATTDDRLGYHQQARKEGIKSILVAPIHIRGEVKGVLRLLTKAPRKFSDKEIKFATALAEQCGIAIENARAYEDQKRQLQYFKTLDEIGKALNSTLQLNEVLDLIVKRLPTVMDVKGCTIRLIDPAKGHLELMAASGLSREYLDRGSIDDELGTHRALKGEPVFLYDATSDPRNTYRKQAKKEGVASILAVPIIVKKRTIGVLRLLTDRLRHFSDAEVNFVMAVAEQGGIAIQNAINYNKISKLVSELEQNEEFLQSVFDSLNADVFVLDHNLRIIMVNRVFLENHRLKESEVIGHPYHKVLRVGDTDDSPLKKLKQEKQAVVYTKRILRKNNEHHLEVMATPVFSKENEDQVEFIIGALRDITVHVRLMEEQRARERLQGVLEMAGAAAHELNNPLFSALGIAKLLIDEKDESANLTEDLQTIVRNLERVSELTRKMSQITRYKAKKYVGDVNIIDIDEASAEVPDEE